MFEKNPDFSQKDLAALLSSPQARALLERLQQLPADTLQNAVDRARAGDTASALGKLMQDDGLRRLAQDMGDGHGGV